MQLSARKIFAYWFGWCGNGENWGRTKWHSFYCAIITRFSRTKNGIVSHVTKHSDYISSFFLSSIRCRRRSSTSSSSNGGNTMHPFFLLAAPISHFIFRVGFSCSLRSSVIWNSYEFGEANGALWCICGNKLMGKNRKNFVFVAPKNLLIYNFRIYISTSPDSRFPKPEKYVCEGACVYTRVVRLYWFNVGAMRAN